VRHRIKQLIDAESPEHVLSDDTIVEKLHEAGIDIARRTVAKYREAMRIASSVQRRREKQAALGAASCRTIDAIGLGPFLRRTGGCRKALDCACAAQAAVLRIIEQRA